MWGAITELRQYGDPYDILEFASMESRTDRPEFSEYTDYILAGMWDTSDAENQTVDEYNKEHGPK